MKRDYLLALATLLMGLWAYGVAGWPAAAWFTFMAAMLVMLAAEDFKTGQLPNELTLPLLVVGVAAAPWASGMGWPASLLGVVLGGGLAAAVMGCSARITGKAGWGMGDLKLLAALGAWVGWAGLLPVILVASCLAVAWIYGYGAYKGKRVKQVPFGPFLAAGGWLTVLYQPVFWHFLIRASVW